MEPFVHLQMHSEYSLLEGACRIDEVVKQASALGMQALAITDYATMYGIIPFYQACKKAGIKPIIGVTVDVITGNLDNRVNIRDEARFPLVMLAENEVGYRNLIRLVSESHQQTAWGKPKVNIELLKQYAQGTIAISTGQKAAVQHYALQGDAASAMQIVQEYQAVFGSENYYLGLQDQGVEEQRVLNQRMILLAERHGIPMVASNDVHYVTAHDSIVHDVLLCIEAGKAITDTDRKRLPNDQFYLKSSEEMEQLFPYAVTALHNTSEIADRCQVELLLGQSIMPAYPLPQEAPTASSYLRQLCAEGLEKRYKEPSEEAKERLDYELSVIEQMGFEDYFLIVWDFMKFAHDQKIVTGPGRGSAAGSLVAYVLFITNIDPLKYKLLFERFLNPERISMPDIDIDFEVDRRLEVIQYVTEKYGHDHVAQIITFGTMAARAAIRDVGRVLNYPNELIDRIARRIPQGVSLHQAIDTIAEIKQAHEQDEQANELLTMACRIEGLPRHASTHAAGIVISKEPLTNYVPLQKGNDGFSLTQYAMECLEEIGLLKMDFLGLRNLTIMEQTLQLIRQNQQVELELHSIPEQDPKTFELLSKGDTTGIFQLESAGMRQVLRDIKPNSMEDIIAILALYRPGPMDIIPSYAAAKQGKKSVEYLHSDLKPILADTYGFILYQEQIMQIASELAGYTLGEADVLRRAVSKKKRDVLEEERASFVRGCLEQGYERAVADSLYNLIVRFADYGFNRSHSAAYSQIAYQMAYFKANYPAEFMTALLTMSIGNTPKIGEYIEEAKKRDISIGLPQINASEERFVIQKGEVLFALSAIKNVGFQAIRGIVVEREQKGVYKDLLDFCRRVDLRMCNRRMIEALIQSGAMDEFPGNRAVKLAVLDEAIEKGAAFQKDASAGQYSLFDREDSPETERLVLPDVPPYTQKEQLNMEYELLGVYLSGHPLDEFSTLLQRKEFISETELADHSERSPVMLAGMIDEVKVITTRKGQTMAFVSLEGKISHVELVVFPTVYSDSAIHLKKEQLVIVQGRVDRKDDRVKLIIDKIWDLAAVAKERQEDTKGLFIKITDPFERSGNMVQLQKELQKHKGKTSVFLYYEAKKTTRKLSDDYQVHVDDQMLIRLESIVGDGMIHVKK